MGPVTAVDEPELRAYLTSLAREVDTSGDLLGPVRARVRRARIGRTLAATAIAVAACALTAGLARAHPAGTDLTDVGPAGGGVAARATTTARSSREVTTTSPGLPAGRDCSRSTTTSPYTWPSWSQPTHPISPPTAWAVQISSGEAMTGVPTQIHYAGVTLNIGPATTYTENGVMCVHPQLGPGDWVFVQATPTATANVYDVTDVSFGSAAPGLPDTSMAPTTTTTFAITTTTLPPGSAPRVP
jgi:hypothetical protein